MKPDDMQFFEEWNPPGHIEDRGGRPGGGGGGRPNGVVGEGGGGGGRPNGGGGQRPNNGGGNNRNLQNNNNNNQQSTPRYSVDLPNLERMRKNGLEMKRAYTASSMCGTSRYSTMTGRYPSRSSESRNRNSNNAVDDVISLVTIPTTKLNDITTSGGIEDGLDCTDNNLAALLQRNGYRTGMFGKWHLWNDRNIDYSYEMVQEQIRACGFDVAEAVYWQNLNDNWTNGGQFNHNVEHMTDRTIQFINQALIEDQPFFVYLNPTAPHASGNVYEALMDRSCMDAPEGNLATEPIIPGMTEGMGCIEYRQTILDRAAPDTSNAMLGALWVDDAVGALLLHLESKGILEDTLFLFQLDHGQEAKSSLYEPGVRIPQFIHYPKAIQAGSTFDGLVSTIDVAPTLADYAGITDDLYDITDHLTVTFCTENRDLYDMDGWSWKSRISSSASSDNNNNNHHDERCVLVELDYDRAVICSCQKYLVIGDPENSGTFTRGNRWGLANESPVRLDLCTQDGNYAVSPDDSSPETTTTATSSADFGRLEETMECLLESTNPNNNPPLYGMCDALLIGPTAAPVVVTDSTTVTEESNNQLQDDNTTTVDDDTPTTLGPISAPAAATQTEDSSSSMVVNSTADEDGTTVWDLGEPEQPDNSTTTATAMHQSNNNTNDTDEISADSGSSGSGYETVSSH